MAAAMAVGRAGSGEKLSEMQVQEESSDSEGETEPTKSFHRRISTNKELKTTKSIKEGYLMKQTNSFQRWRKRYFRLKGRKLYYAKDTKSVIFYEIQLSDVSVAERSTKNVNHSFQVITPFRNLVLCADNRKEMEDWIMALKSAAKGEYYDPNADHHEMMSGQHNWYASSHARPTYCNVCRDTLSGVTSHGLSCEVCKFKAHKRCAVKATNNCKWTTLASIAKDIIEEEDGTISMPHQWLEGNLPVSAKCCVCDKTCGSVLRLQDWRCLWCKAMVHSNCKESYTRKCPLGQCRVSILPPIAINNLDSDGFWEATKPPGTSPLLVFINSKSGDNQNGVKMLRRFKQLLNPAQVFDLINGGPRMGLRLFQKFDLFRILVCGGDGSIGWVLSEIDKLKLQRQCQIGVLPLGTGNDLARVLGWGSAFDDDTQLPLVLEKMEHAQIKMLDRWSILTYEASMPPPRKVSQQYDPITMYEDSVAAHLSKILHSDNHSVVISSAKVLCETVKDFVAKVGDSGLDEEEDQDTITKKCAVLNEKLDALLATLNEESEASEQQASGSKETKDKENGQEREKQKEETPLETIAGSPPDLDTVPEGITKPLKSKSAIFKPRDALMSRANSLKKAVRQIIEHTERAVDEQNAQTLEQQQHHPERFTSPVRELSPDTELLKPLMAEIKITTDNPSSSEQEEEDEISGEINHRNKDQLGLPGAWSSDEASSAVTTPGSLSPAGGRSPGSVSPQPHHFPLVGLKSPQHSSGQSSGAASRRISSMSTLSKSITAASRDKSPSKETSPGLPVVNVPIFPMLPSLGSSVAGALAGGSFISKVLLANADALCAAASPLMREDIDLEEYEEKCVMNNYFGIGLDAKISLEFHNKREEHPEKCRSRTKNMVWYGVIGSKEIVNRTYKNLDQRVQLECDGQRIPLPNLQGIVVLNILSYMGGINFWGGRKENDNFRAPSMDDKVLEVVAVFGSAQLGFSRVFSLQHHRIAQCRSVKISIMGDEGVPVQADGEAWVQPPGYIQIVHKNRAQMLTRDKVFEEALKTWTEKQKLERPISPRPNQLSEEETNILQSFVEATQMLIKSVKMASLDHTQVEQDLFHLATQASSFLDRLYPAGKLAEPAIRTQVSDLVSSVRTLYDETNIFLSEKAATLSLRADVAMELSGALGTMEIEMRKVYEIGGLPHFHAVEEDADEQFAKRGKDKSKFRLMRNLMRGKKEKERDARVYNVHEWDVEQVCQWLDSLGLGEYRNNFVSHDIRGRELLSLGRQDLKDLGVTKVGHLKRIQHSIKDLSRQLSHFEKATTPT